MLVIDNPGTLAFEAGFTGERALSTWKDRMRSLVDLGFIDAKEGPAGPFHYVLLFNPHKVVWDLKGRIQESTFRQLQTRAIDIGAKDMEPYVAAEASTEPAMRTLTPGACRQASKSTRTPLTGSSLPRNRR